MCRLIRYVHADCGCADRDGRMPKTDNSSKHELAWIHFCKDAMQTADAYQTKTKICGGGIVSDLNMEVLTMERMCRSCGDAAKARGVKNLGGEYGDLNGGSGTAVW